MLAGDVYRWGWSEKGRRKYGQRSGKRQKRVNFIAAVSGQKQFIEPLVFEGACTREVVENWLEVLVEQLPQDEDGQKRPHVLVMDNAAFHKGGRIKAILQKARCLLVYLPPYSPQLNPIERCWSSESNARLGNGWTGEWICYRRWSSTSIPLSSNYSTEPPQTSEGGLIGSGSFV